MLASTVAPVDYRTNEDNSWVGIIINKLIFRGVWLLLTNKLTNLKGKATTKSDK